MASEDGEITSTPITASFHETLIYARAYGAKDNGWKFRFQWEYVCRAFAFDSYVYSSIIATNKSERTD